MLKALRDAIRRRELYVAGANRWRNPEDDLPADFELNRTSESEVWQLLGRADLIVRGVLEDQDPAARRRWRRTRRGRGLRASR